MKPVKSSNIEAIGYDAAKKVLSVQFKVGGVYHYQGVGQAVYDSFEKAESIGKFHVQHIKNAYKFIKEEKDLK